MDNCSITIHFDVQKTLDKFLPHLELALEQNLLNEDEASEILVNEILEMVPGRKRSVEL